MVDVYVSTSGRLRSRRENREYTASSLKTYKARIHDYLSAHPCYVCGEPDTDVLQFHHVQPGSKDPSLRGWRSKQYAWDRVDAELAKCVVLCANCHVRVHRLAPELGVKY